VAGVSLTDPLTGPPRSRCRTDASVPSGSSRALPRDEQRPSYPTPSSVSLWPKSGSASTRCARQPRWRPSPEPCFARRDARTEHRARATGLNRLVVRVDRESMGATRLPSDPWRGAFGGYPKGVRLAVGDVVVYAGHGVGAVVAREGRMVQGAVREVLVLDLADGLTVTLPVERARNVLRPLLSEADLCRVQAALSEDHTLSEDVWLKRRKDTQVKLAGGDPLGLAEVVRDGALRERRLIAKRNGSQLSPGEKGLYLRARRLLSGEIGLAHGLEPVEADAWIEEQLAAAA